MSSRQLGCQRRNRRRSPDGCGTTRQRSFLWFRPSWCRFPSAGVRSRRRQHGRTGCQWCSTKPHPRAVVRSHPTRQLHKSAGAIAKLCFLVVAQARKACRPTNIIHGFLSILSYASRNSCSSISRFFSATSSARKESRRRSNTPANRSTRSSPPSSSLRSST